MGSMQRRKGQRGELEWAAVCRDNGFSGAHRGRQYRGGQDSPDIGGTGSLHFEVKRTECLRLEEALAQARRDCPEGRFPAVAHRKNHGEWMVIIPAEVFFEILRRSDLGRPEEESEGMTSPRCSERRRVK